MDAISFLRVQSEIFYYLWSSQRVYVTILGNFVSLTFEKLGLRSDLC